MFIINKIIIIIFIFFIIIIIIIIIVIIWNKQGYKRMLFNETRKTNMQILLSLSVQGAICSSMVRVFAHGEMREREKCFI